MDLNPLLPTMTEAYHRHGEELRHLQHLKNPDKDGGRLMIHPRLFPTGRDGAHRSYLGGLLLLRQQRLHGLIDHHFSIDPEVKGI